MVYRLLEITKDTHQYKLHTLTITIATILYELGWYSIYAITSHNGTVHSTVYILHVYMHGWLDIVVHNHMCTYMYV